MIEPYSQTLVMSLHYPLSHLPGSPYSSCDMLIIKASSLIKCKRQGSQSRPVFGITGVSTGENVVPGLLIQKPQHGLIINLPRNATMATLIISDSQKCLLKLNCVYMTLITTMDY